MCLIEKRVPHDHLNAIIYSLDFSFELNVIDQCLRR